MKAKLNDYIPKYIHFLLYSWILLLVINSAFRVALFFMNKELTVTASFSDIFYCFFHVGLLFDIYISLIILVIPYFLTSIPFLAQKENKKLYAISNWMIIVLALVNIAVSATDLGFFHYYNSRITNTVFDWTDDLGLMLKLMSNDATYLPYLLVFFIVSGIYFFLQMSIYKKYVSGKEKPYNLKSRLIIFFVFLTLIFFGIRGSFNFNKRPLNIDDTRFSSNLFLNQLSINPVYSLVASYLYINVEYFDSDDEAIDTALRYLKRKHSNTANPFEVRITGTDSIRPNIIVIFMESMSNAMVSRYHPELRTTPLLDSLAKQGIIFDNFFSAGIHTHNAIFSIFYGLPAVMHNRPMDLLPNTGMKYYGMPTILHEKNYRNIFYVTGTKDFDNMNDFLLQNGFDEVIGEDDYKYDTLANNWGVSDKKMFDRALSDGDSLARINKPFFMGILTISAHEGYRVSEIYEPKLINTEYPNKLYEYADLLMMEFMEKAKDKKWFDNTVFVFVGDHGQNFSPVYDLSLNYHRIPLILYSPRYLDHVIYDGFGLQIDIYTTLFSLLDFNYTNSGLGVNLFRHRRKYAYFSADNKLGVLDDSLYLIYRGKSNISMFAYKEKSTEDLYQKYPDQADSMLSYAFSMLQSAKYLIDYKYKSFHIKSDTTIKP